MSTSQDGGDAAIVQDGSRDAPDTASDDAASDATVRDVGRTDVVTVDAARDAVVADVGGLDASTTGFRHPGILVDLGQLEFVRSRIDADGSSMWATALQQAMTRTYGTDSNAFTPGSTSYTATPSAVVICDGYNPDAPGCRDELHDAIAAYTQALIWFHRRDASYARRAIAIMNAWSSTLTRHDAPTGTGTYDNTKLQSAWAAEMWTRAAEIIRYTSDLWSASDVARFATMLTNVYLPHVDTTANNAGNWELAMADATISIGVFNDDRTVFNDGLRMWRARVPAYIYLTSDGPTPHNPPHLASGFNLAQYWYTPNAYPNGLCEETCRDLQHTSMGIGNMVSAAETALIQGVDLYTEQETRITAGIELATTYLFNGSVPTSVCPTDTTAEIPGASGYMTYEIALNAFANRLGHPMPHATQFVSAHRPTTIINGFAWETLTHYNVGFAGLP